jgi:hypothetical protein
MTRKPELPLDSRGQIPGQMTVDEVLAEMTEDAPRPASHVPPETDLTPQELQQQKTRREVQGRIARRQALKKNGADVATTNPELAAQLEDRLKRVNRRLADKDALRKAVQARLKDAR